MDSRIRRFPSAGLPPSGGALGFAGLISIDRRLQWGTHRFNLPCRISTRKGNRHLDSGTGGNHECCRPLQRSFPSLFPWLDLAALQFSRRQALDRAASPNPRPFFDPFSSSPCSLKINAILPFSYLFSSGFAIARFILCTWLCVLLVYIPCILFTHCLCLRSGISLLFCERFRYRRTHSLSFSTSYL